MSLRQNPVTDTWEADIKDRMAGRLHISMRTRLKREAMTRYAALRTFVKEGDLELIGRLRDQKIAIEAIERCARDRIPFATLRGTAERWPIVTEAATQYVEWLEANAKKAERTGQMAKTQLKKFAEFTREDGTLFGSVRLDAVTTDDIARYQFALANSLNDGVGHAPNTQTAYITRVGALYGWHREEEARRAIQEGRSPRPLHSPIDPRTQPRETTARERYLSQEEAEALIAATPDQMRLAVILGLYGGLRVSEMLHLQPAPIDIDLVAGVVKIQRKQWYRGKHLLKWKPKTPRSARRVHMNDDVLALLEHHVARYASKDWLFPAASDPTQPMHENRFGERFRRVVEDAGLEPGRQSPQSVSYHTLRHTFASWLIMKDENIMTVAKLLGNSVQMVEDTYGHLAPEHRKKAVGRLTGMVPIPPVIDPTTEDN